RKAQSGYDEYNHKPNHLGGSALDSRAQEIGEPRKFAAEGRRFVNGSAFSVASWNHPGTLGETMYGDDNRRKHVCEPTQNPHDGSRRGLVRLCRETEQARCQDIGGIERLIGENQDGRQNSILKIANEQVGHHRPPRPLCPAWPRLHHRPPKNYRGEKEACMFHLVPRTRTQGQLVELWGMPGEHYRAHEDQGANRICQRGSNPIGERPIQKRSCKFAGSEARQSAHDGDKRRTQKNQRGRHHHQQHVLQHVGRQHESREGIERRSQRDPKGKKSDKKSNGAPGRQLGRTRAAKIDPAAQVNQRRQYQRERGDRRNGPGAQRGLKDGLHDPPRLLAGGEFSCLVTVAWAASRAGGRPGGCRVSRKETKAVTSAGFRFLPYAGILPPPWMTCRTSWSRVRVVAIVSRAGPRLPPEPPMEWQLRHCFT